MPNWDISVDIKQSITSVLNATQEERGIRTRERELEICCGVLEQICGVLELRRGS